MHPERVGNKISQEDFDVLWETLVRFLKTGVKYNRIITADPDEIAAALSWLASAEASFINGALVTADGGWATA